MLYIWSYLKKYPKWLALNLFSAVLFVIVNLGLPTILARMIDEGINPRDVDRLYFWGWVMFAIILLGIVGRIILSYAVGQLTTTMVRDMRNDLYAKLQEYSHREYEQIGVSSLVTRLTSDAFVLMQFADSMLKMGVITPLMMVSSVRILIDTADAVDSIVDAVEHGIAKRMLTSGDVEHIAADRDDQQHENHQGQNDLQHCKIPPLCLRTFPGWPGRTPDSTPAR